MLKGLGWSFKTYTKERRSQGPDVEGLSVYSRLLQGVVKHAKNDVPSFSALRAALLALAPRLDCSPANRPDFATEATDKIKLMMQRLLDMKKFRKIRGRFGCAFGSSW